MNKNKIKFNTINNNCGNTMTVNVIGVSKEKNNTVNDKSDINFIEEIYIYLLIIIILNYDSDITKNNF